MAYSYEPHHFEDFEEGQTFESVGRTVTESDLVIHSMVAGDWTELHTNRHYADEQIYDGRVAHGPFTFILATGFMYRGGLLERTVLAFLGMNYMEIPAPVHIGDTVSLAYEVTEVREVSRDDSGLVTFDTVMTNQDGEAVFRGDMIFLIKRREA
ncbi:MAG: MaoC/PaaZ C-terminal domain-containing protein [Halobacteriales archaeon]